MLTNTYLQIQQLLPYLTYEERKQLVKELKNMIENEDTEPLHDIMEFAGFAEELWKGIDVDVYIGELRGPVTRPKHSVIELNRLGKEIRAGIDPQEYVDRERDSWDNGPSYHVSDETLGEGDKR